MAPEGGKPRPHPPDMLGTDGVPTRLRGGKGRRRVLRSCCAWCVQAARRDAFLMWTKERGFAHCSGGWQRWGGHGTSAESRLDYTFDMEDSESVCCWCHHGGALGDRAEQRSPRAQVLGRKAWLSVVHEFYRSSPKPGSDRVSVLSIMCQRGASGWGRWDDQRLKFVHIRHVRIGVSVRLSRNESSW